eukprot:2792797-Rhodomonas_salina.2
MTGKEVDERKQALIRSVAVPTARDTAASDTVTKYNLPNPPTSFTCGSSSAQMLFSKWRLAVPPLALSLTLTDEETIQHSLLIPVPSQSHGPVLFLLTP